MFPREIVDLIIDNLHNNTQALLQLSLVSFTVSDSSRRHLLRSLTIRRENLDLFLLECDFTHGKAARNQCAAIGLYEEFGTSLHRRYWHKRVLEVMSSSCGTNPFRVVEYEIAGAC